MPIKHDPKTGQFAAGMSEGQKEAHHHLTGQGHEYRGRNFEGNHVYYHPASKTQTTVNSRGGGYRKVGKGMMRSFKSVKDSMTQMDRLRILARDRGLTVLPDGSGLFKATVGRDAIETRDPGIEKTMHEFKRGALHSGSKTGKKVTSRKQAIAIALSKQRRGDSIDQGGGAFNFQKAKRPTMLKSPSSPSADAATQWDRIRRRALDRGLRVGDAVRHDPHTGQFTGAHQHTAAAEHHEEMAGYHEQEYHEERVNGNHQAAGAHKNAMYAHEQAIKAHNAGAKSFAAPGYLQRVAPHASEASRHAAHMTRKAGGGPY